MAFVETQDRYNKISSNALDRIGTLKVVDGPPKTTMICDQVDLFRGIATFPER